MSATALIQARTGSSRLPGKVLLPLDGTPVIKHIIRLAYSAEIINEVIVATTFHKRDDLVEEYAYQEGAEVYRGSEDDVLGRLTGATEKVTNNVIIRLTGDNPFIYPNLIDEVGSLVLDGEFEYVSNKLERTFPIGVDAEALTVDCLKKIESETMKSHYREHALKYVRNHSDEFNTANVSIHDFSQFPEGASPDIRMTLDEAKDYKLYEKIYSDIGSEPVIDTVEAIKYLLKENVENINSSVKQQTL